MDNNVIEYPKYERTNQPRATDTSLLDCYRIALDFGLPAAKRAFENLSISEKSENNSAELYKISLAATVE